jgi:hypothetical protein
VRNSNTGKDPVFEFGGFKKPRLLIVAKISVKNIKTKYRYIKPH